MRQEGQMLVNNGLALPQLAKHFPIRDYVISLSFLPSEVFYTADGLEKELIVSACAVFDRMRLPELQFKSLKNT